MIRHLFASAVVLVLGGCVGGTGPDGTPFSGIGATARPERGPSGASAVIARVEAVAERECRSRVRGLNCDYAIGVDPDASAPPNAFQTVDESGRPRITLTRRLIAQMRNDDELAFVLGHEAAHHIAGHIPRKVADANAGALVLGTLAVLGGASEDDLQMAVDLGAELGSRRYSKEYELEADALGAAITWKAGYDPELGAAYFARIENPGDRCLGTHPPNEARLDVVRQTVARLHGGV
ncbi:MAG: M48 family metallopeptidase [Paracoccaceae bacterium]